MKVTKLSYANLETMVIDTSYHIYVNNVCVSNNLDEENFNKEMTQIKGFLELTNLDKDAKLEYVRCEPPTYVEASY